MKFKNTTKNNMTSEEILDQASKCKSEDLETLLNQIQTKIEQSPDKSIGQDLLRAKTIITSRLASVRSK
jgi:hypothetical protein